MIKNSFISVIQQKEKKKTVGLLNFKFAISPIRYRDLLYIWNSIKKYIYRKGVYKNSGKTSTVNYLSKKNGVHYKKLINQLDIRESKSR